MMASCAPMPRASDLALLGAARLRAQRVTGDSARSPTDVVAALGAVQAQDYVGSLWAIGLRVPGATAAAIERAADERLIVRTWPMRGTLHFVAAADARWMLSLLTPRVLRGGAAHDRRLGIDERLLAKTRRVLTKSLRDRRRLSRPDLYACLEAAGIATAQRGIHIVCRLAMQGFLCCAGREGKQTAFALLDEWIPATPVPSREQALGKLAWRFFTGHGPASLRDLAWWAGVNLAEARLGLEAVAPALERWVVDGTDVWMAPGALDVAAEERRGLHLLAPFDEYLTSYRDRDALLAPHLQPRVWAGGMFYPPVVVDGRVAGTWTRRTRPAGLAVTPTLFAPLPKARLAALRRAVDRYGAFVSRAVVDASGATSPDL